MKNVKKIAAVVVLFVAFTNFVNAQSKVAHIDVPQLLTAMPEMKAAEAELKKLSETYSADIESSMTELRNKADLYQNESPNKSREENEKRAAEIQGIQKNIQEAEQAARVELQKKQQEIFAPISDKAKAAMEKVAKEQGFDYVLDSQVGGQVIIANGKDLLSDVKKELGI